MQHKRLEDAPRNLADELTALQHLNITSLKQRWRVLYGTEPPARISRSLLLQAVAYRLQEQALGGLKSSTRRLLERLAYESDPLSATLPAPRLAPGTVLIREWHGVSHRVTVLPNGVSLRGVRYHSLSEVARKITGTQWSGPRFFGLRVSAKGADHGTH